MFKIKNKEAGLSIIEILMAIVFTSIVAMGIAKSTMLAQQMSYKTDHRSIAMQLVIDILEDFGRINPELLNSSYDIVNQTVVKDGVRFKRSQTVGINADRTRYVTVSITDPAPRTGFTISETGLYTLWGAR